MASSPNIASHIVFEGFFSINAKNKRVLASLAKNVHVTFLIENDAAFWWVTATLENEINIFVRTQEVTGV